MPTAFFIRHKRSDSLNEEHFWSLTLLFFVLTEGRFRVLHGDFICGVRELKKAAPECGTPKKKRS